MRKAPSNRARINPNSQPRSLRRKRKRSTITPLLEIAMKKFLLSDRFFGILLTLFVLGSYVTASSLLESVELKFYDFRAKFRQDTTQPNEVAIIAIDDNSLAQLGRWPWPRS